MTRDPAAHAKLRHLGRATHNRLRAIEQRLGLPSPTRDEFLERPTADDMTPAPETSDGLQVRQR